MVTNRQPDTTTWCGGREPDEALDLASRAAELSDHRDVAVLDALAAAYAAVGRFEEATQTGP